MMHLRKNPKPSISPLVPLDRVERWLLAVLVQVGAFTLLCVFLLFCVAITPPELRPIIWWWLEGAP